MTRSTKLFLLSFAAHFASIFLTLASIQLLRIRFTGYSITFFIIGILVLSVGIISLVLAEKASRREGQEQRLQQQRDELYNQKQDRLTGVIKSSQELHQRIGDSAFAFYKANKYFFVKSGKYTFAVTSDRTISFPVALSTGNEKWDMLCVHLHGYFDCPNDDIVRALYEWIKFQPDKLIHTAVNQGSFTADTISNFGFIWSQAASRQYRELQNRRV